MDRMNKTIVVKLGGSTLGGQSGTASPDTTLDDLIKLTREGNQVVVVHGGGNATSDLLRKMGEQPRFLNGLRVTDESALQAATMMIRGQINTSLVESFNRANRAIEGAPVLALGLSGVDGNILEAQRETRFGDIGYVGEVVKVNIDLLVLALSAGFMPIIAPLGFSVEDGARTFNLNADTATAAIAAALEADATVFLTDVPGVLDEQKRTILRLGKKSSRHLIESSVITGGMIPKVEAALKALEGSRRVMVIDGRKPHALYNAVEHYMPNGTTFVRRKLMRINLSGVELPPTSATSCTIATAPIEAELLGEAMNRAYFGTIDYDWNTLTDAVELIRREFDPDWGDYKPDLSVAASDADKLVGLCQVVCRKEDSNEPCLTNVFSLPEYRGQGVGREVVQESLRRIKAAGHTSAILRVTLGNDVAEGLYRSLGFEVVELYEV